MPRQVKPSAPTAKCTIPVVLIDVGKPSGVPTGNPSTGSAGKKAAASMLTPKPPRMTLMTHALGPITRANPTAAATTIRPLKRKFAVADVIAYAEEFARALHDEFAVAITAANLRAALDDFGRRLALGIVRPEVVALRRLLIGKARGFPSLAAEYFDRAPGQVIEALAERFRHLGQVGLLRVTDSRCAAAQFAYLVAGELLDRAMLVGTTPPREHVIAGAREGVLTFLARYEVARGLGGV